MAENLNEASRAHGVDIMIYVAHLDLSSADLNVLGDRIGEMNWGSLAIDVSVIVSDKIEIESKRASHPTFLGSSSAAAAFRDRCAVLESAPRDVLISFGVYLPSIEVIQQLRAAARENELVSAVVPRIALGPNGELMALGPRDAPNLSGLIDPQYADKLPPAYYFPEILCPCMLMSGQLIGNIDVPDQFAHFPDLILAFLRAGRRRGFLVRVDNRIALPADADFDVEALQSDAARMLQLFDDYEMVWRRVDMHPAHSDERRLQTLKRQPHATGGALLLDCTNIPPAHSGSAEYILGVVGGLSRIGHPSWDVTVMLTDAARAYFSFDKRFPNVRFVSDADASFHDCAIRLSQAWSISTLQDLNRCARSIAVTILDAIGPDVIYAVPEEGEQASAFTAEYADGLIFISEFSRRQFKRRFTTRPNLIESVIHLSLDPAEHTAGASTAEGEWILIFGNANDHKDLERTTRIVSAAFPFETIKVFGKASLAGMNVEAFDSGFLDSDAIDELFRRAKCVLYPSFYEGFGLPLVRGLASGKMVIARRSVVFHEILARFPGHGRFVEFDNSLDLVPILGELLAGNGTVSSSPRNFPSGAAPHDWSRCAAQILEFAEAMRGTENVALWRQRDRAFRYIESKR